MISNFFKTHESYKEQVSAYKGKDALTAIFVWVVVMSIYYFMGQVYARKGIYVGIPVNLALAGSCIALVLLKKEKIASIGFTRTNALKSIVLGIIFGSLILVGNIAVNLVWGRSLARIHSIANNFFYYMIVISLVEEILFRGYIQTRIYGLIKRTPIAVILGGLLFMLIHIPFQMGYARMGLLSYIQGSWVTLIFTFVWHVVFDFLYRKYNAIYAPTIFHGLMDWANYLFL